MEEWEGLKRELDPVLKVLSFFDVLGPKNEKRYTHGFRNVINCVTSFIYMKVEIPF